MMKPENDVTYPVQSNLLANMDSDWPETFYVLSNDANQYGIEVLRLRCAEDEPILEGLACFETISLALIAAEQNSKWGIFKVKQLNFDFARDLVKGKPHLTCMVLHREGELKILIFTVYKETI